MVTSWSGQAEAHADSALVERDAELRLLDDALRLAAAGRGSALLFEGQAGGGKSALLEIARSRGPEAGLLVLAASGRELERDAALGVVLQLLETRVGGAPKDQHAVLFAGAASQALPLFASGPRQALEDPPALMHGLYRLCANLASERRPLLLAVDDVDLADVPSLRFLLYLIERVETLPLVLVLSSGGAALGTEPELVERAVTHPSVQRRGLEPLSPDGTALCLRTSWLPSAPNDVAEAVHAASAGNPAVVDVLGSALRERGRPGPGQVGELAPPELAARALARARQLGPSGPALLRAVAVLGPGAAPRHAAVVASLDPDGAARIADRLTAAGVFDRGEELAFAQPAVAAAVRAEQPSAERASANLRAAETLAAEEASPERIATHLLESTGAGRPWAVSSLCSAAEIALGRGEPEEAVRYLRRALDEPPPAAMRAHVLLELGRAEATAGDPAALTRLGPAIDRAGDSRERARAALQSGRTLFALGRPADAVETFARALDQADDRDDPVVVRQLRSALRALSWIRSPGSVPLEAETGAADLDQPDRGAYALAAFAAAGRCAPHEEVHALAVQALDRGALLDEDTSEGIAYHIATAALIMAEDLQTAEAAATAAIEDARARGSVLGFATASLIRSLAIGRRGRVADAAADARLALAAERHGWRIGSTGARAVLAGSLVDAGDREAAERHIGAAERGHDDHDPGWTALLASRGALALASGNPAKALDDFLACGERLHHAGIENPALVTWRSGAARAHAALGDRDEALQLAQTELDLASRFGAPGLIGGCMRTLGTLTGGAEGVDLLHGAVAQLGESQLALERARALADLGAALRRLGRRSAAREPLRESADLAQRCGAEQLATRALAEARLAGARPRRTALHGLEALTPRERETAQLAASGMSNREIADTLFVTVKTVEWHLKHTYRKLGLGSRRDLRGLFDADSGA
jgi:DNA-binding CsgD family transcriptional regulator